PTAPTPPKNGPGTAAGLTESSRRMCACPTMPETPAPVLYIRKDPSGEMFGVAAIAPGETKGESSSGRMDKKKLAGVAKFELGLIHADTPNPTAAAATPTTAYQTIG